MIQITYIHIRGRFEGGAPLIFAETGVHTLIFAETGCLIVFKNVFMLPPLKIPGSTPADTASCQILPTHEYFYFKTIK